MDLACMRSLDHAYVDPYTENLKTQKQIRTLKQKTNNLRTQKRKELKGWTKQTSMNINQTKNEIKTRK